MKQLRNNVIRAGLGALYFSGAHHLLRPIFSGIGVIFTLHHVRPPREAEFQPNRHLEVNPEFLRAMLTHLRSHDIDIITLDEVHDRLKERNFARRFACFTFDDGCRDITEFALPLLRQFDAPATIFVTSDFAEGRGPLWWTALEAVIARASTVEVEIDGAPTRFETATAAGKQTAFDRLQGWLRNLSGAPDVRREIDALCARYDLDAGGICRELCMSWDELKSIVDDPLVTFGAHSVTHCNFARQREEVVAREMADSRARLENVLQRPVLHFAYPYGNRSDAGTREFALARAAGFKTAMTTRPGMIFPESVDHLTALPRVSLNGNYQDTRILPVLTSGAATAMWNGFRRIDAA